jgi:hypothetical protein
MNAFILTSPNSSSAKMIIKTRTWNRDSHGLFDYESDQIKQVDFIPKYEGTMLRKENKNEVIFLNSELADNNNNINEERLLARIKFQNGKNK